MLLFIFFYVFKQFLPRFTKCDLFDEKKLFGISALATIRARTFLAHSCQMQSKDIEIPVIGGHSKETTVPLLSLSNCKSSMELYPQLVKHVREAGTEIIMHNQNTAVPALAMAYTAAKFANCLCMAIDGKASPILTALVKSDLTDAKYFCSPIIVEKNGISKHLNIPALEKVEEKLLAASLPVLIQQIDAAEKYISNIINA